jgi:hypothetical protein
VPVCVYSVCVAFVVTGLSMGSSPFQGVQPDVYGIKKQNSTLLKHNAGL